MARLIPRPRWRALLVCAVVLGLAAPVPARAFSLGAIVHRMTLVRDYAVQHATHDLTGQVVSSSSGDFKLGRRLGAGASAAVHRVVTLGGADTGLVTKVPHRTRFLGWLGRAVLHREIRRENRMLEVTQRGLPGLERDPGYPRDPSWRRGSLPVVPIVGLLESTEGPQLLKRAVVGRTVGQLKADGGGRFTPEQLQGFADIVAFQRSVRNARLGQLDINPTNLLWIEDPKLLGELGYRKPGFILFELSTVPTLGMYRHGMGLADYMQIVDGVR